MYTYCSMESVKDDRGAISTAYFVHIFMFMDSAVSSLIQFANYAVSILISFTTLSFKALPRSLWIRITRNLLGENFSRAPSHYPSFPPAGYISGWTDSQPTYMFHFLLMELELVL